MFSFLETDGIIDKSSQDLWKEAEAFAPKGYDVILDIENEGAKQIRDAYPGALMIFISPPSLSELADRLAGRGDTSDDDMTRRLGVAESQMNEAPRLYDHIVINDELAGAISQVLDILNNPATAP